MRPRTLRTRLTLLYVVPFFLSGVALLAVPILQTSNTQPAGTSVPPAPGPGDVEDPVLHNVLAASAVGLAVMVVVSVVLGWLVAGRFLRPLRTITTTARDISASSLHRRLGPTGRNDEFTRLAETLDDLFARLEASFESQRRFVANASHELRTPLTAERTLLQVNLADPDATVDSLRSACRDVLALGEAQERLIESLLTLASGEQGVEQREAFDLADIADGVVQSRVDRHRSVRVEVELHPAPAAGDPSLVESLVANLVDNAMRHNVTGGLLRVATSTVDGHARLRVSNTGPVIAPDDVGRLLEPFQRLGGQRVGHADGHGLGLAIVHAVADSHGATLSLAARPSGGLDVEVTFP